MTAVDPVEHEVIHLGGQAAVVVPMEEYRRLRALERHASEADLDVAAAEAAAVAAMDAEAGAWQDREDAGQTRYTPLAEVRWQLGLPDRR